MTEPFDTPRPFSLSHLGCACHRPELRRLTAVVTADLSRRGFFAGAAGVAASVSLPDFASAQTAAAVGSSQVRTASTVTSATAYCTRPSCYAPSSAREPAMKPTPRSSRT